MTHRLDQARRRREPINHNLGKLRMGRGAGIFRAPPHVSGNPGIDATNHKAEQAIRPAVVNRKVWGGTVADNGLDAKQLRLFEHL
jgi:hypothetical protein